MNDLISRQAAIDAFLTELTKRERKNLLHTWSTVEVKYFITDMLEQLPSADAVPVKHGVWEKVKYEDDDGYFYLYVHKDCGCEQARERNYCPNCGADMRERKDDE